MDKKTNTFVEIAYQCLVDPFLPLRIIYDIRWYNMYKKLHIKHIYGLSETKMETYFRWFTHWLFGESTFNSLNNEVIPLTYKEYKYKYL